MSWTAFRNIISALLLLAHVATAQDARLDRLWLQYAHMRETGTQRRAQLSTEIAHGFLAEGDYQRAAKFTAMADSLFPARAALLRGEALFLQDYYRESLGALAMAADSLLTEQERAEKALYTTLNYHHRLEPDSAIETLTDYLKKTGGDTAGVRLFYAAHGVPTFYRLKKAVNRSFIPGGGLFYVDEPRKAVTSILAQSVFAGYAAYSVYTRHYITAALTGGSQFMRFYGGGRRAARNSGAAKNRHRYLVYVLALDRFAEAKIFGQ